MLTEAELKELDDAERALTEMNKNAQTIMLTPNAAYVQHKFDFLARNKMRSLLDEVRRNRRYAPADIGQLVAENEKLRAELDKLKNSLKENYVHTKDWPT